MLKEEDKGTFAAPKLLKINRRDKNAVGGEQLVQPVEPEPAKEEDKPIFAPRRLNLRNKVEKKEDIYTPSLPAGDKEDATIHPSQLPQEEYKPKFNFGVED